MTKHKHHTRGRNFLLKESVSNLKWVMFKLLGLSMDVSSMLGSQWSFMLLLTVSIESPYPSFPLIQRPVNLTFLKGSKKHNKKIKIIKINIKYDALRQLL